MTRKVWLAVSGLLLVGLVVGGAVAAGDKVAGDKVAGDKPGKVAAEKGDRVERFAAQALGQLLGKAAARLELTEQQTADIKTRLAAHRQEIGTALSAVRDATAKLEELTVQVPVNEEAVRAAAADLGRVMGDAALVRAKVYAEIKPLLSPEQVEKLNTLRSEVRGHVGKAIDRVKGDKAR